MRLIILGVNFCLLFNASDASSPMQNYSEPELLSENSFSGVRGVSRDILLFAKAPQRDDEEKAEHSAPELPLPDKQENFDGERIPQNSTERSKGALEISDEEKDRKFHKYLKEQKGKCDIFGIRELSDDEVEFKPDENVEVRHSPLVLCESSDTSSPISDFVLRVYPLFSVCSVSPKVGCSKKIGAPFAVLRPSAYVDSGGGSATGASCGDFSNQCSPNKTPELPAPSQS